MVPMGADGSSWTSFSAVNGGLERDLPVPVVLLLEPKPPKPVLCCCCWLFCPNPEKDMVTECSEDAREPKRPSQRSR